MKSEQIDRLICDRRDFETECEIIFQTPPDKISPIKWILTLISRIDRDSGIEDETSSMLFHYLEENFSKLDRLDKGIYWHLKAYRVWTTERSLSQSLTLLNRSFDLLEDVSTSVSKRYKARVCNTFGQISYASGFVEDAVIDFTESLTGRIKGKDLYGRALTLGNLGRLHMDQGEYAQAIKYLEEDLSLMKRHFPSNTSIRIQLLSHLGRCYLELDEITQATRFFQESLELAERTEHPLGMFFACLGLGESDVANGDYENAESWYKRVSKVVSRYFHNRKGNIYKGFSSHLKGLIQYGKGELKKAANSLQEARDLVLISERISPVQRSRLLMDSARLSEALGDSELASGFLSQTLSWLDKTGHFSRRQAVESRLKEEYYNRWLVHSAMRITGRDVETLLESTGEEGFKGERKQVGILFADIRDFTQTSEKIEPEAVIEFLNIYLTRMIRTVDHYSGYVDKILGDALMAVFSLPDSTDSDAERAALTALVMQEEIKRLNRRHPKEFAGIRAGCGLHYGAVVAGLIGSARKRSYTVIGDVVNVASRLESLTKILKVPILGSGAFRDAMKNPDRFFWLPMGNWIPYGREEGISVYSLLGENVDNPHAVHIREQILTAEEGFRLYYDRDFKKAMKYFDTLVVSFALSSFKIMSNKCQEYLSSPPEENWDGSFLMYGK